MLIALNIVPNNNIIWLIIQADVCHAYQLLRKNGVPAGNIITMIYDDIANHTELAFLFINECSNK